MYGRKRGRKKIYRTRRGTVGKKTYRSFKRAGVGRRRYRKTKTFGAKWLNPISQSKLVRFVYADSDFSRTLTAIGGWFSYYVFRGNSPYDPDYTGVGVQPYGWDQLMIPTMYMTYRSPASSIKVFVSPSYEVSTIRRLHCFLFPYKYNTLTSSDLSDIRMLPFCRETVYDGLTESTKGGILKSYCRSQQLFSTITTKSVDFSAGYNANPAVQWYWIIAFYTNEYDTGDVTINFDVKIKYYCTVTRNDQPNES